MQIHWFTCTIHSAPEYALGFYDLWLRDAFGAPVPGPGGMFFTGSLTGLNGARIYTHPLDGKEDYWTVVLPGLACECVSLEWFKALSIFLRSMDNLVNITRLDVAFDDFPFTPVQMRDMYAEGNIVSPARPRGALSVADEFHRGHDGSTWAIGSRQGGRYLRVYDRRGCNRIELELHSNHAQKLFWDLFDNTKIYPGTFTKEGEVLTLPDFALVEQEIGRGAIEAFCRVRCGRVYHCDFKQWLACRYILDTTDHKPARDVNLQALDTWMTRQVAVPLSVVCDLCGVQYVERLILDAILKRQVNPDKHKRYAALLDYQDCVPSSSRATLLEIRGKKRDVDTTLLIGGV